MSNTVLITGGSGLVGSRLTEILLRDGYLVKHLGRSGNSKSKVKTYTWDIKEGIVEDGAFENVNIVIHLAGAGVGDKRWTEKRKKEIIDSRVQSTRLLYSELAKNNSCKLVVAASAIGIYGLDTGDQWVDESTSAGDGFLADVTKLWEREIAKFEELKLRVVTFRIGVVLSSQGGAFPKIAQPIRMNAGAALGSGRQFMSWIHIDDLCTMITTAIENVELSGIYNAVAPKPVTNKEFTKKLAQLLNKSLWMPPVPAWALKVAMGEMSQLALGGNRVSANKIHSTGYHFKYPELQPAFAAIIDE